MNKHQPSALSIMSEFDAAPSLPLEGAVRVMYGFMDAYLEGPPGYDSSELAEVARVPHPYVLRARPILSASELVVRTGRKGYTGTGALLRVGKQSNELFCQAVSEQYGPGNMPPKEVRQRALGLIAVRYKLGIPATREKALLAAAQGRTGRHPAHLLFRGIHMFAAEDYLWPDVMASVREKINAQKSNG